MNDIALDIFEYVYRLIQEIVVHLMELAAVGNLRVCRIQRKLSQNLESHVRCHRIDVALPKQFDLLAAIRALQIAKVLNYTEHGDRKSVV